MNPALLPTDEFGVFHLGEEPRRIEVDGWTVVVSSDYVAVGDLWTPTWAEVEVTDGIETVSARAEVRDGRPCVTEIVFRGPDIQQRHLTETEVSSVVAVLSAYSVTATRDGDELKITPTIGQDLYSDRLSDLLARRRNRRVTPELLARVAEVYRANIDGSPTKAVQSTFFVSERQAGNYVRKARDAGLLPPTTSGKKKG